MQADDPASEYWPGVHCVHHDAPAADVLPAEQAVQFASPALEYVPAVHDAQQRAAAPPQQAIVPDCPAGQLLQVPTTGTY